MRFVRYFLAAALFCIYLCTVPWCHAEKPGAGKTVKAEPTDWDGFYRRGKQYAVTNQDELAISDFKKAIELDPGRFETYKALDDVFSKRADWDEAILYWNRYLELQPDSGQAYCERGGAYSHKKDIRRALSDTRQACRLGFKDCCQAATAFEQIAAHQGGQARDEGETAGHPLLILSALIAFLVLFILWARKRSAAAADGSTGGVGTPAGAKSVRSPGTPRMLGRATKLLLVLFGGLVLILFGPRMCGPSADKVEVGMTMEQAFHGLGELGYVTITPLPATAALQMNEPITSFTLTGSSKEGKYFLRTSGPTPVATFSSLDELLADVKARMQHVKTGGWSVHVLHIRFMSTSSLMFVLGSDLKVTYVGQQGGTVGPQ